MFARKKNGMIMNDRGPGASIVLTLINPTGKPHTNLNLNLNLNLNIFPFDVQFDIPLLA